jgi:NAD(P)-dependent dehydrogenase (short-subunit alcohol dehydrogenase family)
VTAPSPHARVPAGPQARRFEGQVVFITGAARGQGRAEAVRFAAEGADIIAVDICADLPTTTYPGPTPDDLAETARLVEDHDRRAVTSIVDVRDFDALGQALHQGVSALGRLDVVVANAGMTTIGRAWEIPLENWDVTIGINLTGAYYTARAAIPIMIDQGTGGAIVFTSSVAGLRGLPLPITWQPSTASPGWPRASPTSWRNTASGSTPFTRTASTPA